MILASVTHYIDTNTLEATWLSEIRDADNVLIGYERAKCRSYSADQIAEFLADCGEGADKYTTLAGWQ